MQSLSSNWTTSCDLRACHEPASVANFVSDVSLHGFAVIKREIEPDEVTHLRCLVDGVMRRDDCDDAAGCDKTDGAGVRRRNEGVRPESRTGVRMHRGTAFAARNLLSLAPQLAKFVAAPQIRAMVEPLLGAGAAVVRSILFDKNPAANWLVPWHQDTTIAVRERIDTPGFGPWSVKSGVVHVRPPAALLGSMLTIRVHLDDALRDNGALHVIPGSHRDGFLSPEQIESCRREREAVICECDAGDILLMRPLLLHASYPATTPTRRRVLHFEFAAESLPYPLAWAADDVPHDEVK